MNVSCRVCRRLLRNDVIRRSLSDVTSRPNNDVTSGHSDDVREDSYDVIVVGGGHAGCEAAAASARIGCKTLLLTHKISTIGEMSCNPSLGGVGKGHLMAEVDALGGLCARMADTAGISFKVLNTNRGPAVHGPRAQIDRRLYRTAMQEELRSIDNLQILTHPVENLLISGENECIGVTTPQFPILSKCVIICTGTFLRATMFLGQKRIAGGRLKDDTSIGLADTLDRLGFKLGRLKTGTPPRIYTNNIDFTKCQKIATDEHPLPFSFVNKKVSIPAEQRFKYEMLTRTSERTKQIVLDNIEKSPFIEQDAKGPRYCPSLEAKCIRFSAIQHQVWLETEGLDCDVIYPNGLSISSPEDVQLQIVRSVPALERAEVAQWGYGVQYDYVDPRQLGRSLESRRCPGLFLAGQVNGTTGYEEAAAQGVLAGINAANKVLNRPPLLLERTNSYIGVLVDDLTSLGAPEPYRMFTSRAENRIFLRCDNADYRLTHIGHQVGSVDDVRKRILDETLENLKHAKSVLSEIPIGRPVAKFSDASTSIYKAFTAKNYNEVYERTNDIIPSNIRCLLECHRFRKRIHAEAIFDILYSNASREAYMENVNADQSIKLPKDVDYSFLGRSVLPEVIERLNFAQPDTLAAFERVPGVTPASVGFLLSRFARHNRDSRRTTARE